MIKNLLLVGSIALSSTLATAQTKVTTGVMRGKEYGVAYTLPKTNIQLSLTVKKSVYTPGEFSKYASTYLHLETVDLSPKTYWTIEKMSLASIGIPDAEKTFFVEMKDKTVAPHLELTTDGLIKSINMPFSQEDDLAAFEPIKTPLPNPRNYFTEEILVANSTAKMAELVAKEIYSIRESRNSLLRGEAENTPQDGNQLKIMLDNLQIQEVSLLSLFKGSTVETNEIVKLSIEPEQDITDQVIGRFSSKLGVVDSDNLVGEPIYISIKNLNTIDLTETKGKQKTEGIAYNMPGKAKVTVKYNNKNIISEDLPVTQFGSLEYLSPVLFNKKSKVKVLFNPMTGSVLKIDREEL